MGVTSLLKNSMASVDFDCDMRTVVVAFLHGDAPRHEFDELKTLFIRLYKRVYDNRLAHGTSRICIRFDLSECGWINHEYVSEWAQMFKEHRHITEEIVERSIIVIRSPLMRAAVRAFFAIYPSRRPVSVVSVDA